MLDLRSFGATLGSVCLVLGTAHAQGAAYADKAAAVIHPYVQSDLFSGAILVAKDGQPLYRKAFGFANREWSIPNTLDTRFRIGSVTKQFTAAAILQLVERGQLKLDDPISNYYTSAPSSWQKITIHHLLTHTSGIPDYVALPDFPSKLSMADRTPEEVIQLIQNEPTEFEPGTQFAYNNTGYVLLGYVIQKVTGKTYEQYFKENIFGPLGMRDTGYDNSETIISRRASGYRYSDGHWENAPYVSMTLPFAAGALYSTVDDLLVWNEALSSGKVLNDQSLQAMFTDYGHAYGFGWAIRIQFGHVLQTHGGGINGFRATIDRYPSDKLTIIILSNVEQAPVEKIARELAALQVGVAELHHEAAVDPTMLDGYVGHYQLGPKFVLEVSRHGNRLFVQPTQQPKLELLPGRDRVFFFRVVDAQITFEVDSDRRATRLVLHQNGMDLLGERIEAAEAKRIEGQPPKEHKKVPVDPKVFDNYIGRYQLSPNIILTILRDGGRLLFQATGQPKIEIFPEDERDYLAKIVDAEVTFETDDHGRATRLILHRGGLDIPAERIDY